LSIIVKEITMRLRFCMAALVLALVALPTIAAERALGWQGKGADGKPINFDPDHLQRPAIILFWATWCPYCEELMPYLQKVYNAAGRGKLDVYAIDIKEDGDPVAALKERKLSFTLVLDGDAIADQYGVKGTPGLFLVNAQGDVIYKRSGGDEPAKVEGVLRQKLGLPVSRAK
jgi:cytochrome c biogenesis protein CcmG, thiol:disulfide interchange protein DsbE